MKFVTTEAAYRVLVVETDAEGNPSRTVSAIPLEVSNEDAEKFAKLGESVGVPIVVSDTAPSDADTGAAVATRTPDLSAGVGAITGSGDPVTNTEAGIVTDGTGNETESGTARTARKVR